MITPFTADNRVDYEAAQRLARWYGACGCHGIFAVCQSSELYQLSSGESAELVRQVRAAAQAAPRPDGAKMAVIASGHVSLTAEDQARELIAMYEAGADAVVLITNRMDYANEGDGAWIQDAQRLLELLPPEIPLGLYECPSPYKRLLSDRMLSWCAGTGRFHFIKDTCCDAALIAHRMQLLSGTGIQLFNANAQTLLESLKSGGSGYCGIMANFHPQLYVWLFENYQKEPEKAERVEALLSMMAFTEALAYPVTAKYHLGELEGLQMSLKARSRPSTQFTPYDALVIRQMKLLADTALQGLQEQKER